MDAETFDWEKFSADLLKVHNEYLWPSIERARQEFNADPAVLIHGTLTATLNLCQQLEPDDPDKAQELFITVAADAARYYVAAKAAKEAAKAEAATIPPAKLN
jgi:hypothetical protein